MADKKQTKVTSTRSSHKSTGSGSPAPSSAKGARGLAGSADNSMMQDRLAAKAPALDAEAGGLFSDFGQYQGEFGGVFGQALGLVGQAHSAQDAGDLPGFHRAVDELLDVKAGILFQLDWFLPGYGITEQISYYIDENPDMVQVPEFREGVMRVASFGTFVKAMRGLVVPFLVPRSVHGKSIPAIPSIPLGELTYTEAVQGQVELLEPLLDAATEIRTLLAGAADAKGARASAVATDIAAGPISDYDPGSGEFEYLCTVVANSSASKEVKARVEWLLGRDDFGEYEKLYGMLTPGTMWEVVGEVRAGTPMVAAETADPTADQRAAASAQGKTPGVPDFDSSKLPPHGGQGEEGDASYAKAGNRGMARTETTTDRNGKLTAGDGKVGGEADVKRTTKKRSGAGAEIGADAKFEAGETLSGEGNLSGKKTDDKGNTRSGSVGGGVDAKGDFTGKARYEKGQADPKGNGATMAGGVAYDKKNGVNVSHDLTVKEKNADGSTTSSTSGVNVNQDGKVTAKLGTSVEDAKGNKRGSSGSGSMDLKNREAAGAYDYSHTDKDGNDKGSAGGSASIDLGGEDGKRGAKAEVHASHGGKSVSLGGGYTITVNKPVEEKGQWIITWETALEGQVSGGVKNKKAGASATIGGANKKTGRRSFKTEAEAKAFFDDPKLDGVPSGANEALAMAQGDQVGKESSFNVGADASAKLGAVEIGAGASHSSSDFQNVTKGEGGKVRVEVGKKEIDEVHGSIGMAGVSAGAGKSYANNESITVEFDLDSVEGRRAYEHHQKYHALPRGARGWKVVGDAKGNAETNSYNLGLLGVKVGTAHTVASSVEHADGNKYERDSGTDSTSVSVPLLGSYERTHGLSMLEVNDGRNFFNTESTVKGSDLDDVRGGLRKSAQGTEEGSGGSNKGTYRLQSAISEADMDRFIQVALSPDANHQFLTNGGNHAADGLDDLRSGLKKAAGDKDQQRKTLARWIADEGDEALRVLHTITHGKFDQRGEGGTSMFVAIDGDPYMDGMKGQLELELRIQGWDGRLRGGERGPALASEIRKDIVFQRQKSKHLESCSELPARVYLQEYDRIRSNVAVLDSVLQRAMDGAGASSKNEAAGLESPRFMAFRRACANLSVARLGCEDALAKVYKDYTVNEKGAFMGDGKGRKTKLAGEKENFERAKALYDKGGVARQSAVLAETISNQTLDEKSVAPLTAIVTKARSEYLRSQRFYVEAAKVYWEIDLRNAGKGPSEGDAAFSRLVPGQYDG